MQRTTKSARSTPTSFSTAAAHIAQGRLLILRIAPDISDPLERRHKIIWNAMHVARNVREGIDMITVSEELEHRGYLDEIGGIAYLSELLDSISPNESPLDVVAEWRNR